MNNATQVVFGAIATKVPSAMQRALLTFERHCPVPGTTIERVVLRGAMVEMLLQLETALADWTSAADRALALRQLHDAPLLAPLEPLLAPARSLVAAAHLVHALPLHERARNWIDEHPDDPRSIGDMAAVLGAHPRTLNRHFVRHVGKTVQEYRWDRRVERVQQLMATSGLKVEDVASAVGARSKATVYRLLHKKACAIARRRQPTSSAADRR
ncbi:MAG TPA: AraC family transcriptional regulator [Vicinamibacterales bacterium]|nr:AraC family transcriptional regulator [Vicinamibacterales bacterium]